MLYTCLPWLVYHKMRKVTLRVYTVQLLSGTYRLRPYCLWLAMAAAMAGCRVRKNNVDHFHKVHRCAVPPARWREDDTACHHGTLSEYELKLQGKRAGEGGKRTGESLK